MFRSICFALTVLLAQQAFAESCQTIKVGGGNWLDINELNNLRGTASGASILLLHKLPELLEVKIQYEPPVPFARQLKQLEQGKLDVVAGVYPTKEREEVFLFTKNYYYEKLFIFAKPTKISQLLNIDDLKKHTGAIIRGASYGADLDRLYQSKNLAISVNNQNERLGLLLLDRADYFVGTVSAVGYSPEMQQISISNKPIYRQGAALAFSPKTQCKKWIPQINEIIDNHFK